MNNNKSVKTRSKPNPMLAPKCIKNGMANPNPNFINRNLEELHIKKKCLTNKNYLDYELNNNSNNNNKEKLKELQNKVKKFKEESKKCNNEIKRINSEIQQLKGTYTLYPNNLTKRKENILKSDKDKKTKEKNALNSKNNIRKNIFSIGQIINKYSK
jgi:predicted nuclease with TOPRIM domain